MQGLALHVCGEKTRNPSGKAHAMPDLDTSYYARKWACIGYFQLTAKPSAGSSARSPVCVVLCLVISSSISFQIVIRGHFLLIRAVFRVSCCLTNLHRPV